MALKLNLRPEIEEEMEDLLPKSTARSKTDYINRAIQAYNKQLKRHLHLENLAGYFEDYATEAKRTLREFSQIRRLPS